VERRGKSGGGGWGGAGPRDGEEAGGVFLGEPGFEVAALAVDEDEAAAALFDEFEEPLDLIGEEAVGGEVAEDDEVVGEAFVAGGWEGLGDGAVGGVGGVVVESDLGVPAFVSVEVVVDVAGFPTGASVEDEDAAFAIEDVEGDFGGVVGAGFLEIGLVSGGGDLDGEEAEGGIGFLGGGREILDGEAEIEAVLAFSCGGERL
jgi:hypothetical protein